MGISANIWAYRRCWAYVPINEPEWYRWLFMAIPAPKRIYALPAWYTIHANSVPNMAMYARDTFRAHVHHIWPYMVRTFLLMYHIAHSELERDIGKVFQKALCPGGLFFESRTRKPIRNMLYWKVCEGSTLISRT